MFRLKKLDDEVLNPKAAPVPISAMPHIHNSPAEYARASPYKFHNLIVSAAVIHDNRLLIVKRAEEETSFSGCWEVPGGSVDATDKTIADAVARELREETGLTMNHIINEIQPAITFGSGWERPKRWLNHTFLVEVTETAKDEAEAEDAVKLQKSGEEAVKSQESEEKSNAQKSKEAKFTSLAEVIIPFIKLDPKEHSRHLWVTSQQILAAEYQGEELQFISDQQTDIMLTAFQMHKEIGRESLSEAA